MSIISVDILDIIANEVASDIEVELLEGHRDSIIDIGTPYNLQASSNVAFLHRSTVLCY